MKRALFAFLPLLFSTAALTSCQAMEPREREILNFPRDRAGAYEEYLVNPEQYTTKGKVYHLKYKDHLLGMARSATEKYNLDVAKNSIGFYHDKKQKSPDRLYLGIDFNMKLDSSSRELGYGLVVEDLLKRHISDMLYITRSGKTIHAEQEIVGCVIGMRWTTRGRNHLFNFWIENSDAALFEAHRITLDELIERNTITNSEGQVIRLRK